jgi:hypothetical protein
LTDPLGFVITQALEHGHNLAATELLHGVGDIAEDKPLMGAEHFEQTTFGSRAAYVAQRSHNVAFVIVCLGIESGKKLRE